jgi:FtsH-binding integral membrane protein
MFVSDYRRLSKKDETMALFFSRAFLKTGFMLFLASCSGIIGRFIPMMVGSLSIIPMLVLMGLTMYLNHRINIAFVENNVNQMASLCYSNVLLFGTLLGMITILYDLQMIAKALFTTCFIFTMSAGYGYLTKKDMSRLLPVIQCLSISCGILCLIGIVGSLFRAKFATYILSIESFVSIIFSVLFIIYFMNSTKKLYLANRDRKSKLAALNYFCAYVLFSNFVNIFLAILRLSRDREKKS